MKRKTDLLDDTANAKKAKLGDYCNTPVKCDASGLAVWPAPREQMTAARKFLQEW